MPRQSRRAFLATVGALAAGTAGCTSTPTGNGTERSGPVESATDLGTVTTRPGPEIRLQGVEATTVTDATVTVLDRPVADALREAARGSEPARGHAKAKIYDPALPLAAWSRVALDGESVGGAYDVSVETGPRIPVRISLDPAGDVPDEAEPIQAATLSSDRRALVAEAVDDETSVPPETANGQWLLNVVRFGYVEYEGTVYSATRRTGTDEHWSTWEVYWVLDLTPTDGDAGVTLDLETPGDSVREVLNPLLRKQGVTPLPDGVSATVPAGSPALSFARETEYLHTLDKLYEVRVE